MSLARHAPMSFFLPTKPWANISSFGRMKTLEGQIFSWAFCGVQIHFPFPFFKQTTLADGLQEALDLGLATAVGVCNYNTSQLEQIHGLLDKKGIPLATNQVSNIAALP